MNTTTTTPGDVDVLVTNMINNGCTVFSLPGQRIDYDSTGTYPVGVKTVTVYRPSGRVEVNGRFTNRELASVFAAVIADAQS